MKLGITNAFFTILNLVKIEGWIVRSYDLTGQGCLRVCLVRDKWRGGEGIFLIKCVWFKIYEGRGGGAKSLQNTLFASANRGIWRGGVMNFDI